MHNMFKNNISKKSVTTVLAYVQCRKSDMWYLKYLKQFIYWWFAPTRVGSLWYQEISRHIFVNAFFELIIEYLVPEKNRFILYIKSFINLYSSICFLILWEYESKEWNKFVAMLSLLLQMSIWVLDLIYTAFGEDMMQRWIIRRKEKEECNIVSTTDANN